MINRYNIKCIDKSGETYSISIPAQSHQKALLDVRDLFPHCEIISVSREASEIRKEIRNA